MRLLETTRAWARRIKRDAMTLWFARSHPATPWLAKALAVVVVAYALSPIDLIPDFIPVLGYLDDLIIVPAGLALALKMVPPEVIADCRLQAAAAMDRSIGRFGLVVIVAIWLILAALALTVVVDALT